MKMVYYEVTVYTGDVALATTFNSIFIKLVGTDGESERQRLLSFKWPLAFVKAAVRRSILFSTRLEKILPNLKISL